MYIIDVQGFNYGSDRYMWKEIAIFNMVTETCKHKFLKMPHQLELFNHTVQKHMNWLFRNLHGLEWDSSGDDFLSYDELSDFIKSEVKNDVILVKGLEKKRWLETFLGNQIIDLYEIQCPNLDKLKDVFKSYHCNQHIYNNLNCSMENVYLLFNWYKYCNKINCLLTYPFLYYCVPVDPNPPCPRSVIVVSC